MHESFANDRARPDEGRPVRAITDPNPSRKADQAEAKPGPYWGPHAMATSVGSVAANERNRRITVSRSGYPTYGNVDMAPCDYNR